MINILFADDGSYANIGEELCGIPNFNLVSAKDSKNVLETLKNKRPEIILMGNFLDGMDRHTLTRILKNDSDTASIKILFIEISLVESELMKNASGTHPIKTPVDIIVVKEALLNAAKEK